MYVYMCSFTTEYGKKIIEMQCNVGVQLYCSPTISYILHVYYVYIAHHAIYVCVKVLVCMYN